MEFNPEKKDEILAKRQNRKLLKKQGKLLSFNKREVENNSPLVKRHEFFKEQAQDLS